MSDDERPVWLLDVDGVINVDRPASIWGSARRGTATADGQSFPMLWAPALIDRIRAVHEDGLAEVVWCTTWCSWAGELERLFELPELRRAFLGDGQYRYTTREKIAAARRVIAADRPLIWTDDDAVPSYGMLHDDLTRGGRALLIRPSYISGLKPRHLDEIVAFCERMRDE